jgi:hypothetical protein
MPRSTLRAELSVLGLTASTKIEFPKKNIIVPKFSFFKCRYELDFSFYFATFRIVRSWQWEVGHLRGQ